MGLKRRTQKRFSVQWWIDKYFFSVVAPVSSRSGWIARLLAYPLPWLKPWGRKTIHVEVLNPGLGDELMGLGVLRELKRRYPGLRIRFYARYEPMARGLDFLESVSRWEDAPPDTIRLRYPSNPRRHAMECMADCLGLRLESIRPACATDSVLKSEFREKWESLGGRFPVLVVSREDSSWSPYKKWGEARWSALLRELAKLDVIVVEIGTGEDPSLQEGLGERFVDLRGKTSIAQLAAIIASADLFVGNDSGPAHIATALDVKSVILYGGYSSPSQVGYATNENLASRAECAPCWRQDGCPYDVRCWREITPTAVAESIRLRLAAGSR